MNTTKNRKMREENFLQEIERRKQAEGLKEYETPDHNYKGLREALPHNCISALRLRKSGFLGSAQYWKEVKAFYKKEVEKTYNPRPPFMWCRQMVEMGNRVF